MPESSSASEVEQRQVDLNRLVLGCAWSVVVVSLANLGAWWAVAEKWMAFGLVLPAPRSASVLFILLGAALVLRQMWPGRRGVEIFGFVIAGVVLLAALSVAFGYMSDRAPRWEGWLGDTNVTVAGLRVGRMLLAGSLLFGGTTFPFFVFSPSFEGSVWLRRAAVVVAALITCLCSFNLISYTAGNPVFTASQFITLTLPVSLNFVLLNAGLLFSITPSFWFRKWLFGVDEMTALPPLGRDHRKPWRVLGLWCFVTLAVIVTYLRIQTAIQRDRTAGELLSMTELKASEIVAWRAERLADAHVLANSPELAPILQAIVNGPDRSNKLDELSRWLGVFERSYKYRRVLALNAAMEPLAPQWIHPVLSLPALREQLRRPVGDTDVVEFAPYVDEADELRWDLLVVIRPAPGGAPVGAILLQTNVASALWPILRSWGGDNHSGQVVLWYRYGNHLFSLGGLRSESGPMDAARRPFGQIRDLTQPNLLLARVANGERGLIEGLDVRGIPIVGLGQWIPESDWLLSCRVDAAEVYAPVRQSAWQVVALGAAIFGVIGLTVARSWRERQRGLLHDRMAAELEQKRLAARLGAVMRHAKDIILLLDEELRVVDANQQAIETYGWSREELLQKTIHDLRASEAPAKIQDVLASAVAHNGTVFDTLHMRKDGTTFPAEASVRRVELDGKPHLLSVIRDITERKRAEKQLRDSEEKFSKAFQANPIGIAITDYATGRYIEVNESFCRVMGHSSQGLIGRTSLEVGVWDGDDNRRRIFQQLLATGDGVRNFELQTRTRDGETKTTLINAEQIELNGQRCIVSLIEDITDRKRTEVALRASEERYRLIADNTSDLIWLYDRVAERFTYASPSALPLLGYRPEEFVGRKLLDFVTPASKEEARRALERAMGSTGATRTSVHLAVELEQQRKDGSLVPTEVVVSVLLAASGQITHLLGVTRDITERKKARETLEKFNDELEQQVETRTAELASRNREIEALVKSIPDTVLLCDERGELITSHFAQNRASSFPFANVGGGDGLSAQHPVLLELARELHAVAWASQQAIMLEFDRTINGMDYSIEARATPAGEHRLLILLRDISARKRSERVAQANLERERQLSEMKSQFISVASHEFRTPLAAAVGSLELLERHAARLTDAKRSELLVRSQRSLGRLTEIMNDVLQVSRADSGRVKVKLMNVDLGRFVQDVVNEVAEGDRHAHTFSFQQSGGPATVPADTSLLNHVVSNLIGNAARYSPAGTKVSVTLALDAEAFTVTVADEGIGIPAAERERIFEPFVRGSNVGPIGGTGLGLNIVKRYTELMGGRIEVLPTDRGATFRIRVPCTNTTPSP
jgi:PAS domain S-box-containing protein